MSLAKSLSKLFKYLGTRNIRTQSKGLPKGMGMSRRGQVKKLPGGQRILKKEGGGTTFLKGHSKAGPTRGTKIATTTVPAAGALYAMNKAYTGAPTAGQKQFSAVKTKRPSGFNTKSVNPDIAKFSKSGYHTYKKGSKTAKLFQQAYAGAKKSGAKSFIWGHNRKKYAISQ